MLIAGTDFALAAGQTVGEVIIQAGQNRVFLELDTIDDAIPRGTRKLEVSIDQDPDDSYGIRIGTSSVYMDDNETYPSINPVVGFSTANSTVIEKTAGKATEQDVTVSMSSALASGEVTVEYRLIGGSATGRGVDYSLKIPASDLVNTNDWFLESLRPQDRRLRLSRLSPTQTRRQREMRPSSLSWSMPQAPTSA
jgi:hypothetical protein